LLRSRANQATSVHAQVYSRYGGPEVLELRRDLPDPRPAAHEVLVEIRASSVNPIDWKLRRGNLRHVLRHHLPAIPGRDFYGVVLECGAGATSVAPGDLVFGLTPLRGPGSHAERICLPESHVALAPTRVPAMQAAALPLTGLTAVQAIEAAGLRSGQRVLVQGGAGAVGSLAVQYAVHLGARVLATASAANLAYLRSLGAEPIDYRREPFEQRARELDAVIDCVGGEVERRSFSVLRRGGKLVTVAGPEPEGELDLRALAKHGVGGSVHLLRQLALGRRYAFVSARVDHRRLVQLARLVDQGVLATRIDRSFPLERLADAHRASERGEARGKLVIEHES
jgi:NADPH:quinone reductase-like Zn-dependent oxidoreductase